MKSTFVIGASVLALAAPAAALADQPGWTTPQTLSGVTTSGEDPQVAVGATGAAVVIWEQDGPQGARIVSVHRSPGGAWSGVEPVSATSAHSVHGQQVAMAGGATTAVWQSSGRIQVALRPAGGAWTSPRTLSRPGGQASFPQVAMSPSGAAVVVWQQHLGGHDRAVVVRRPAGGPWSSPRTLSGSFGDAAWPQVALDAHGNATVVWERDWADGGRSAALVVRRPAGGRWTAPMRLSAAGQPGSGPVVAMDPSGDTLVAWMGRHAGHGAVEAVLRPAHRTWGEAARVSGVSRAGALGDVAMAPSGTAVVVWHRWGGSHSRAAATIRPAGRQWQTPATLSEPGVDALYPHVVVGGGVTTVTWETTTIEGARLQGGSWGGVMDLSAGTPGEAQQVASNAAGDVLVVWKHFEGTHDRVMVTSTSP